MRFNPEIGISASQIVNSYSKDDLLKIFREYGEEPASRKIAEEIFTQRKT
jgi:16S rRNA (cytosine1402-N4)-methyltransferase